ncbi:LysR family transcriptional regulator [Segnochrobactraceae bacterium EtOH-i3]
MRWSLRHLTYAVEASRLGSIAAAAERLGVSQAAVSGAINNIEDAFGVRVFQRQPGRGLTLTASGATLIAEAQSLLEQARRLEETAALLSTRLSGSIRLGCFPTAVPHIIPSVMEGLRRRYPALTIDLQERTIADLATLLKSGRIDVALTYDTGFDEAILFESLFEVHQHVAISQNDELAAADCVSLHQLVRKPMILLDLPVCRERILDAYINLGLTPKIHFQTGSTSVVERLVASGQGYAMLGFRPEPARGDSPGPIRFLRVVEQLPGIGFGIARLRDAKPSRAQDAFLDLLRDLAPRWTFS